MHVTVRRQLDSLQGSNSSCQACTASDFTHWNISPTNSHLPPPNTFCWWHSSFLHWIILRPSPTPVDYRCVCLLLNLILFHWSMCAFLCQYHNIMIILVSIDCFIAASEIGKYQSSNLGFHWLDGFGCFRAHEFLHDSWSCFSVSAILSYFCQKHQ